ncbi:MAG: hypothetical protein LQ351_002089 [Letrouitia transgressa]|nr:MAG: hypothetical protein LQ351_002089 [Letrouitia transgressa]
MAIPQPGSSSAPSQSQPLTFPPAHFAKLAPKSYLHAHLTGPRPLRPSGRSPRDCRKPAINTSSLANCHGSAVVRLGDTAVVCGIRAEILRTEDAVDYTPRSTPEAIHQLDQQDERIKQREEAEEVARLNLLVPNVELSTGCTPSHLPGNPPSTEAQFLSHRVLSLLHTSQLISPSDLRIWSQPLSSSLPSSSTTEDIPQPQQPRVRAFYTLHITLLFLSLSGIHSAFPSAWLALLAALRTTTLPQAWYDEESDSVLCDPDRRAAKTLKLNGLPIASSFGVFVSEGKGKGVGGREGGRQEGRWILADTDGFEERCCDEEITVVVRESSEEGRDMEVLRVEKEGGGVVGKKEMRELLEMAEERWRDWGGILLGG